MLKKYKIKIVLFYCLLSIAFSLNAKEYRVVVPQLPTSDIYKNLMIAIADATNNKFNIEILPFARYIYMIETRQADIGATLIEIPDLKKQATLNYDYSTIDYFKMTFVLYTNKSKPIDVDELKKGNPKHYRIETDSGHINHFEFQPLPSSSIEASLQKVSKGDVDGYVFSQTSGDNALKKLDLKNIKRQFYGLYNARFILPKGQKGSETDKMLTNGIIKIKANGKFEQIMGAYVKASEKYVDWQP